MPSVERAHSVSIFFAALLALSGFVSSALPSPLYSGFRRSGFSSFSVSSGKQLPSCMRVKPCLTINTKRIFVTRNYRSIEKLITRHHGAVLIFAKRLVKTDATFKTTAYVYDMIWNRPIILNSNSLDNTRVNFWLFYKKPPVIVHCVRRSLSAVLNTNANVRNLTDSPRLESAKFDRKVSPELLFRASPSDDVGLPGKQQGAYHAEQPRNTQKPRYSGPISGRVGCIRCLPLGAQIISATIFFGSAWFALWRAFSPFSLILIRRRDVMKGIAYACVSMGLFAAGFGIGMWGV